MNKRFLPVFIKCFALVIASLVVSAAILEAGLRMLGPQSPVFDPRLALYPCFRIHRKPSIRGLAPSAFYTTNTLGLRGAEPPIPFGRAYSIITVGGSTTMCALNDDAAAWPAVLERELNSANAFSKPVWIGNSGIDGQSTAGHLVMMRHVVSHIRPDCVIFLVGLNDASLIRYNDSNSPSGDAWFLKEPDSSWNVRLVQGSRLLQFAWLEYLVRTSKVVPGGSAHIQEKYPTVDTEPPVFLDSDSADSEILARLQMPESSAIQYEARLRRLIEEGRKIGTRMVFVSQPVLYGAGARDYDDRFIDLDGTGNFRWIARPSGAMTLRDMGLLVTWTNRITARVAHEEGIEFIDLASKFPRHQKYFYDGYHFTDAGAELAGKTIARYLAGAPVP